MPEPASEMVRAVIESVSAEQLPLPLARKVKASASKIEADGATVEEFGSVPVASVVLVLLHAAYTVSGNNVNEGRRIPKNSTRLVTYASIFLSIFFMAWSWSRYQRVAVYRQGSSYPR